MENNVRIETMYNESDVSDSSSESNISNEGVKTDEAIKPDEVKVDGEVKEESKVEPVKEEPVAEPVAEPKIDLSNRFAKLSKKEKELRELENNIKAKQAELEKWNETKEKAKSNPAEILNSLGVSLEDFLVSMAGEDVKPVKELTELEILRNEIDELKKSKEAEKLAIAEEAKAKEEQKAKDKAAQDEKVLNDFKAEIKQVIEKSAEQFEIINAQGAYDSVFDVISQHFEETGEVMPIDKAASMVEEYLENQYKVLLNLNKFKKNTEVVKEDVREVKEVKDSVKTPKTLNNGMTNSSSTKQSSSKLTREQRIAEAARMLAEG